MLSLNDPLSLYAIPAMWAITYYPSFKKARTMKKLKAWDNVAPRSSMAKLSENKDVPPELAARIARMDGAHNNGLENLPFFGLAVLAGNFAGLDNQTLNIASGLYLLFRVLYNFAYIRQRTEGEARFRGMMFSVSIFFPFFLLIKAAKAMGERK